MTLRSRTRRILRLAAQRALIAGAFPVEAVDLAPRTGDEAAVVMCLWNRPSRIDAVIDLLDRQDHADGVTLHLWNNRRADHAHYRAALHRAEARVHGALRRIELVRSPYNTGSIGRFFLARRLARGRAEAPIIVLDDDQDVRPDFVARAIEAYDPLAISAWWAWNVRDYYWDREATPPGGTANYIGPGGAVMSDRLFLDGGFFTEIPEQFRMLDDIWLSHRARRAGLELRKLDVEVDFVLQETNQYHEQSDLKPGFWHHLTQG